MKKLLLTACLLALICTPVIAGKNAGGALVVHTGHEDLIYTDFHYDICQDFEDYAPTTCEELSYESTFFDPNWLVGSILWYVAAFHPETSPGVTVIYFGHDHNFNPGYLAGWSFCGPLNSLEIPDAGWPDDVNAGNAVAFGSPIAGDHLFPFYWIGAYAEAGNYIGPTINPTGGYAGFVSDDNPGVIDEITRYGQVRWFEPGFNDCPVPDQPEAACCFDNCACVVLTEEECVSSGGVWGFGDSCDPNPCPCPYSACCLPDGTCYQAGNEDECFDVGGIFFQGLICFPNPCSQPEACCLIDGSCLFIAFEFCDIEDGEPLGEGTDCDPNPCPTAVEETTWGSIKSSYR